MSTVEHLYSIPNPWEQVVHEMLSGKDHHFTVEQNGNATTPLIKFGQQLNDVSKEEK